MRLRVSSFPLAAAATGLRRSVSVSPAAIGRLCRTRAATVLMNWTSVRSVATRPTTTLAATGGSFAQFKGSPNSEHTRAHSIL